MQAVPSGEIRDLGQVVLESEPPRRLSYSWHNYQMVKLTLIHDDFEFDSEMLKGVSEGWPAILSCLKTLLETGQPLASDGV